MAVALTVVSVGAAAALSAADDTSRSLDPLGFGLIVLACGALAVRRAFPVGVLALSVAAVAGYLLAGYPYGPVMLAVAAAVYTVARRLPTGRALLLSGAAYLALVAHIFVNPAALPGLRGAIPAAAWIAIPATLGVSRRLVAEARLRERAATERRWRDEERLRIAHEVHDVVGHGLAAIQMQADIALHLAARKPDHGVRALEAISSASAAALAELRDTLRAITPDSDVREPRAPAASLDHLAELCDRVRATGVEVDVSVSGEPRRLPGDVDLAAYRVVQEALTNVVRHAVVPRASVAVDYAADAVVVTVTSPHDGTEVEEGFGIRGMRRRVTSVAGDLTLDAGEHLVLRAALPDPGTPPKPSTPKPATRDPGAQDPAD